VVEQEEGIVVALESSTRSNIRVVKPLMFNRDAIKISDFIMVCRLYLIMRIKNTAAEKQIQ